MQPVVVTRIAVTECFQFDQAHKDSTVAVPCGGMPASPHTPLPHDGDCQQESAVGVAPATPPADSAQWSAFYMNRFLTRS